MTIFVCADLRVAVLVQHADIQRIDRSNQGCERHQVAQVRIGSGGAVNIAHVGAHLEPVANAVVSLQAGREALVVGLGNDTVLIQVAGACVIGVTVAATADVDGVLLTEAGTESLGHVVVGKNVVRLAIGIVGTTQRSVRVQLAVDTDEVLTFGNGVRVVLQTLVAAEHTVVGPLVSGFSSHTVAGGIVVQLLVVGLYELVGVSNGLILLDGARVGTPLHVHIDLRCSSRTLLGGHQDHTGGTTGTIQSCRGSILQNSDALDILRRNVQKTRAVGRTVDNDQRINVGIHRGKTTDGDMTAVGTGRTAGTVNLQARNGTHEGVLHIGRDLLTQFVSAYDSSRTREGGLCLLTESNDHDFVEKALIRVQGNTHTVAGLHHATEHTDVGNLQTSVGARHSDGEFTVEIGHGTCRLAKNLDGSTRQGLSIVGRDNGALHLSLGDCHSYT